MLTDGGYNVVKYSNQNATHSRSFNNPTSILYNTKYNEHGLLFTSWTQGGVAVSGSLGLSDTLALNDGTNGTYTLSLARDSFAAGKLTVTGIPYGDSPYWNNSPTTDQRGVARTSDQKHFHRCVFC